MINLFFSFVPGHLRLESSVLIQATSQYILKCSFSCCSSSSYFPPTSSLLPTSPSSLPLSTHTPPTPKPKSVSTPICFHSKMNPALDIDPLPNSPSFQTFPMSIKTASPPLVFVVVLLLLLCSIDPSVGDPRNSQATLFCGNRAAAPSDRLDFAENFKNTMEAISSQVSSKRYARVVVGTAAKSWVYASAGCIDRLSDSACDRCVAQCRAQILRCLPGEIATRAGRIYLDGCNLRFDEYDFFGEAPGLDDRLVCSDQVFIGNWTAAEARRRRSVEKSSMEGRPDESFFGASVVGKEDWSVGELGQCGKFVNKTERRPWGMRIGRCLPRQQQEEEEEEEAGMLKSGCYMRYPVIQLHDDLELHIVVGGELDLVYFTSLLLVQGYLAILWV